MDMSNYNCRFSLHSPYDATRKGMSEFEKFSAQHIEDHAFSCFAQAQEGNFTVSKLKLNAAASLLAFNWVNYKQNPNNPVNYKRVCSELGFDYNNLLDQEVDYLAARIEEEIRGYECS